MIFRRFLYGIKEGTRNIFRNKMFSLASLGTIIACVFLLGTFLSVALNVRSTMQQMEQSVGISVFFVTRYLCRKKRSDWGRNKEKRRYCHDAVCIC